MKRLILAISLLLSPQLANAQSGGSGSYCGKSGQPVHQIAGNTILGEWELTHHAGYVQVGGMVFPYPAIPGEKFHIVQAADDRIYLIDDAITQDMELVAATEPPWKFQKNKPNRAGVNPVLTDQDIVDMTGCSAKDLPRLIGHGTYTIPGTGQMDMTARFIVMSDKAMFGILEFTGTAQGQPFQSRRSFTMAK